MTTQHIDEFQGLGNHGRDSLRTRYDCSTTASESEPRRIGEGAESGGMLSSNEAQS